MRISRKHRKRLPYRLYDSRFLIAADLQKQRLKKRTLPPAELMELPSGNE